MRHLLTMASLAMVVGSCWIGALGAWRMRDPMQSLHYLSVPATVGTISLTIAIFLETGWSSATIKGIVVCAVLVASNSIGAHAAARAIRTRRLGHWEPRKGDGVEFVARQEKS